jgi:hypothetical protein
MTLQEHNDLLACITFFLKGTAEETNLYFGGYSSKEAWDAFSKLLYNMTGDELCSALNDALNKKE